MTLRYTLLCDGRSDQALIPIISWTLREHIEGVRLDPSVAELGRMRKPPARGDLAGRMEATFDLYPCDVLFVHRDAERPDGLETRRQEISQAKGEVRFEVPVVSVVPVRMTEAWLLFDEYALRAASGNPKGTVSLKLPPVDKQERVHAKEELADRLRRASARTGRRAKRFSVAEATQLLANRIDDFAPLRKLPSFQIFEAEVTELAAKFQEDQQE